MDVRQEMTNKRKEILEQMDSRTLLRSIGDYFDANATMPREKALKDKASDLLDIVEELPDEVAKKVIDKSNDYDYDSLIEDFAKVSIKEARLKNVHATMDPAGMPFPKGIRLTDGEAIHAIQYVMYGLVVRTSADENAPAVALFNDGTMSADIPPAFIKQHPDIIGKNIMVNAVDYSNGKGKNVVYDMYVDMMQHSRFDMSIAADGYTDNMETEVFKKLSDRFEAFVPGEGSAPTVGGEMVRAMSRIGYRYMNDGDKLNDGYGKETTNMAGRYLIAKGTQEVKDAVEDLWAPYTGAADFDSEYEVKLTNLAKALDEQFEKQPELFTTQNKEDMFDYVDRTEDVDDSYDEEEDEYDDYDDEEEDEYEEEEDSDFADAVDSIGSEDGIEM